MADRPKSGIVQHIHFFHVVSFDSLCGHRLETSQVPGHLLKYAMKYKHLGMLIFYNAQCCFTTREVLTTAIYCKALELLPGSS